MLVGRALRTEQAIHERLTKKTDLAVFSSDALSSVAYSTEAILLVLLAAGTAAITYLPFIAIGITILLAILVLSYRQTIHAYPSGGGAYIVAKDNLGTMPGLIAAASLLVDYILTVSVSVAAGVAAITSTFVGTRLAWLDNHRVAFCIFFIAFVAIANLRGVRESGALFAGPTYAFIASFLFMIGYGLGRLLLHPEIVPPPNDVDLKIAEGYHPQYLSLFLLLGAFSNGCAAL